MPDSALCSAISLTNVLEWCDGACNLRSSPDCSDVTGLRPRKPRTNAARVSDQGNPSSGIAHWFTMGVGAGVELVLVTRMCSGDGHDRVPFDGQCEYRHPVTGKAPLQIQGVMQPMEDLPPQWRANGVQVPPGPVARLRRAHSSRCSPMAKSLGGASSRLTQLSAQSRASARRLSANSCNISMSADRST